MKKHLITAILLAGSLLAACSAATGDPAAGLTPAAALAPSETAAAQEPAAVSSAAEEAKRTARDDALVQTENPEMPTRLLEGGTRINMQFGDTVLPGRLNDSETAQALIELLPYTVHLNSYSHDFCGIMPDDLPYNESQVHYGWLNGDIDYAIDAPYFTILHSDEDISEQYGSQVNIGVLDCELDRIRDLSGSYDVLITLAE